MIIGIGGCSNSGKSLLAKQISDFYQRNKTVKILCQDDFVKRRDFLTTINEHVDWELPSTIEIDKYISSVKDAEKQYDLLICEGLFAFWFDELNILYDKYIFLEIDEHTFKHRKQADLRWGKEPDWYIDHIWQSHMRYGQLNLSDTNIIVTDATKEIKIEQIIEYISF